MATLYRGEADKVADIYPAVKEIQSILAKRKEKNGGPFWHGSQPGIADLGIAPFVGRLKAFASTLEPLKSSDLADRLYDPKGEFALFAEYTDALMSRPSWSKTFDQD